MIRYSIDGKYYDYTSIQDLLEAELVSSKIVAGFTINRAVCELFDPARFIDCGSVLANAAEMACNEWWVPISNIANVEITAEDIDEYEARQREVTNAK